MTKIHLYFAEDVPFSSICKVAHFALLNVIGASVMVTAGGRDREISAAGAIPTEGEVGQQLAGLFRGEEEL